MESLDLSSNDIAAITTNLTHPSLTDLDLGSNDITTISNTAFCGTSLTTLNLGSNGLSAVPDLGCINETLTQLMLNNNDIATLATADFTGLANLEELTINQNALSSIAAFTFSELTNLDVLNLNVNPLTVIHDDAFCGTSLRAVYIESLSLTNFPDFACVNSTLTMIHSGNQHTDGFTNFR